MSAPQLGFLVVRSVSVFTRFRSLRKASALVFSEILKFREVDENTRTKRNPNCGALMGMDGVCHDGDERERCVHVCICVCGVGGQGQVCVCVCMVAWTACVCLHVCVSWVSRGWMRAGVLML
jgi:hypothetical protein